MSAILNLSGKRRVLPVRQAEAAECGNACLVMVANFHGHDIDMPSMRRRFATSMKGTTLKTMIEIGNAIQLVSRAVRCEPEELNKLSLPAILHWRGNHFVVLEKIGKKTASIVDPAIGTIKITLSELSENFTGIALELSKSPSFQAKSDRARLKLVSLVNFSPNVVKGLVQATTLSLVIELLFLAAPFYLQLVIDDALVKGNINFLQSLAVGFAIIMIFRVATVALRGFVIQFVSQTLSYDMQSKIFHHLLRLPLEWFSKRQIGDIQSRFGSIQPIQSFISNGAITGILDGLLGTLVLIIMFVYSVSLASLVLGAMLLTLAVRLGTLRLQKRLAGDLIVTQAFEQTRFLESLRAITTVKATGAELAKEGQQRNAIAAAVNSMIRAGNLRLGSNGANALIDGIADILVIYLGAYAVLEGDLTVGMLMAFVAYKQQFGARFTNLVETMISWKLLSVDLDRLSDIALAKNEKGIDGGGYDGSIEGRVECRNVTFSYAFGEQPVLSSISLKIEPGEFVAIVGASGCGKSTLVKLLVGLYRPSSGKVLLDDRPLEEWDLPLLRRQIALVTQEDSLMAGSIAENIALFADDIDLAFVKECARVARIHDDIIAMPMGYETLVGDMGSSLSSGQQQRVMIARALYRRPKILVLDEGTSHLDSENEAALNRSLCELDITRIIVAHRPETIAAADRQIEMKNGKVQSARSKRGLKSLLREEHKSQSPDPVQERNSKLQKNDYPTAANMAERWNTLFKEIAKASELDNKPRSSPGELVVIGSGISHADFLIDAQPEIQTADVVFYCLYDRVSQIWLHHLRPDALDLRVFYAKDLDRFATYTRMAEAMLYMVRQGKKVVSIYYGHPGVFATPTHRAIKIARREGHRAIMRPGISALDYLIADVGFDPALPGLQSFEATDMLLRSRRIDPSLHVVLWQVGVVGELDYDETGFENRGFNMLVDELLSVYGPDWSVTHYIAPQYAGIDPMIDEISISELKSNQVKETVSSLSTFYIAPKDPRATSAERSLALGTREKDDPVPPPQNEYPVDRYGSFERKALAELQDFVVSDQYYLPEKSEAARFLLALSLEPELRNTYRRDPALALKDPRFSGLTERAFKLLQMSHPRAVAAALADC